MNKKVKKAERSDYRYMRVHRVTKEPIDESKCSCWTGLRHICKYCEDYQYESVKVGNHQTTTPYAE